MHSLPCGCGERAVSKRVSDDAQQVALAEDAALDVDVDGLPATEHPLSLGAVQRNDSLAAGRVVAEQRQHRAGRDAALGQPPDLLDTTEVRHPNGAAADLAYERDVNLGDVNLDRGHLPQERVDLADDEVHPVDHRIAQPLGDAVAKLSSGVRGVACEAEDDPGDVPELKRDVAKQAVNNGASDVLHLAPRLRPAAVKQVGDQVDHARYDLDDRADDLDHALDLRLHEVIHESEDGFDLRPVFLDEQHHFADCLCEALQRFGHTGQPVV